DALERLTGRPGRMEETSSVDRAALRVGGEPVPLLAEVLQAIDLEINVEIKSNKTARMGELVAATAKVIRDSSRADHILISSFDPFALVQFHRHLPDIALAYLFHEDQPLPLRRGWVGRWSGASLLHPQHSLCTAATIKSWHTAGHPVNAWTVDDEAELIRLANLGVDGVFSNDVAHAVSVLAKL
ncbi:MAG: glycerophosphodiester phosphodiesterase, partial [Deltaproteobacteria bacterium]|nr:glycerophosphodiester phosphodiesterase [Deltaproteobacteria bacterium]